MQRTRLILVLLFSLFALQGAYAQEFVCGEGIVETGEGTTKEEVLAKCGPPSDKDSDRWYYRNQPGQVTVVLTFETGKLNLIETVPE